MKRLFNIEKFTRINKRSILQSVRLGLCLVSVLSISPGFAEEAYKLSGIMAGDKPTAIINDQIVAVGDWLGNVRVTRIGEDHVICQGQQGAFELKLNVSASPVIKTEKSGAVKPAVDLGAKTKTSTVAEASQGSAEIPGKARRYMEQSVEYLKEADQLLKAPLISERIYTKAADLCDLA
ncbi:MAG: hypothetical protein JNN05_05675, partial [Candidatus Omnitrophica bacterium]|nr:hypothetical protein [Candidatus Omnitrophota bacterium]